MNGVIYARYSSDNQREESIEGQLRECMEFAERQGITVVGNYIDRALSAKTDGRPDFQRMIKDSAKRLFDVVIVWKLDRFARNRYDSAHYKNVLHKYDVRVISAKENISDGPEGIILESMLEGMAEYYSAELSVKVKRGLKENTLKCRHNGGHMPYGYTIDTDRRYIVEPVGAALVQKIFTRYADGESVADIISDFTCRGLKAKRGGKFSYNTIHNILCNRKYMGEYYYGDTVIADGVPAIISKELFEHAQRRVEKNRRIPGKAKAKEEYLLTTKLYCGNCGTFMVGESGTSKTGRTYHYYKCFAVKRGRGCKKKAVKKDWIEECVVNVTIDSILNDREIERIADMVMEVQGKENGILPSLRKQFDETKTGIENMLNAIQKGIVTRSTQKRLEELETRQEELELAILREELSKPLLTKEQIIFWISRFKNGDRSDPKFRQKLIDYFFNAVYLYDDRLVLTYNYKDGTKAIMLAEVETAFCRRKCEFGFATVLSATSRWISRSYSRSDSPSGIFNHSIIAPLLHESARQRRHHTAAYCACAHWAAWYPDCIAYAFLPTFCGSVPTLPRANHFAPKDSCHNTRSISFHLTAAPLLPFLRIFLRFKASSRFIVPGFPL